MLIASVASIVRALILMDDANLITCFRVFSTFICRTNAAIRFRTLTCVSPGSFFFCFICVAPGLCLFRFIAVFTPEIIALRHF